MMSAGRANRRSLSLACIVLFLGACLLTVLASARHCVPSPPREPDQLITDIDGDRRLFPWLTRLRDGLVEAIFGPPPSKKVFLNDPTTGRANYRDHVVLRFNLSEPQQEAALSAAANRLFLDIWAVTPTYVDVRVRGGERHVSALLSLLPNTTTYSLLIPDVASLASSTYPSPQSKPLSFVSDHRRPSLPFTAAKIGIDNLFFQDYQPLSVVVQWMRLLEAMFPALVETVQIGTSFEGRDILALRVGAAKEPNPDRPTQTILITGGIHAREWISTSSVNYVAWSFITNYGKELMITKMLQHFDIVFIPIVNPDGVEYTWNVDRLWRKSRQETSLRFCRGLDLDHAFGYEWGAEADVDGLENDPCSESYGGSEPFQAVEAYELSQWAKNETEHNVKFIGFLDLHSYSQQVLYPYSYSCAADLPNLENLEELATGLAKAIRLSSGEVYSIGSACEGAVTPDGVHAHPRVESYGGSAMDWFYHDLGVRYAYQIKLRDTGSYGFLLPKEQIIPTGEEIYHAVKYFGDFLLGNNGIEKGIERAASEDEQTEAEATVGSLSTELRKRHWTG